MMTSVKRKRSTQPRSPYRRGQNPLGLKHLESPAKVRIPNASSDNLATLPVNIEFALSRAWPSLSRRERQVAYLYIIKGLTRSEIAEILFVSENTLISHLQRVREGLKARTAPQSYALAAVRYYQELQLVGRILKALSQYPYPFIDRKKEK